MVALFHIPIHAYASGPKSNVGPRYDCRDRRDTADGSIRGS